jgi:hypothetical protein
MSIRNPSDIITLNVAGTHFITCISTLTSRSSYFEAMFSKHWVAEDGGTHNIVCRNSLGHSLSGNDDNLEKRKEHQSNRSTTVFIDKDPIAFQYLLKYMREGYLDLPNEKYSLCKDIILQAQYFGLHDFITQVKQRAVRNSFDHHGFSEHFKSDLEDDYIDAFDHCYPTLVDAFENGCLPYLYFEKLKNVVCLQVGDVKYTLNKTMLRAESVLMEQEIDPDDITYDDTLKRSYYIDLDPEAFSYLVHYIRHSQLDLPSDNKNLFLRVLLCAEFMKMDDFLTLVKARTMMGLEMHEAPMGLDPIDGQAIDGIDPSRNHVNEIDQQYAAAFNRRFRTIGAAFKQNILPTYFFQAEGVC